MRNLSEHPKACVPLVLGLGSQYSPLTSQSTPELEKANYFRLGAHSIINWYGVREMGLPPRDKLWPWHATLPGSQRCLTFAGETFDVEMLGLDPEALPLCTALHIYGSEWQASLTGGEGLEGGPLKENRERSMWVESIPIKDYCRWA